MPMLLTDADIQGLFNEAKPLPDDLPHRIKLKAKHGHEDQPSGF